METIKDKSGQLLLHVAADSMNNSAIESLRELGLAEKQINLQDNFGMTPRHIASINFDLSIFSLLDCLNPDKFLKDQEGKTFLDYLKENDDVDQNIVKSIIN